MAKDTTKQTDNHDDNYNQDLRWYIIQTYVGFEDAVKKDMELKIKGLSLEDKLTEIFIPTKKVIKLNAKGERQEKVEKIYPGYIYIRAILNKDVGYLIQNTNYVSRIAGTGDFAVALEEGYVEKLKEQLLKESTEAKSTTKNLFSVGEMVQVREGPFKDMTGKISAIDPNSSRVSVLLNIFDRETNVELDVLEIKKYLG